MATETRRNELLDRLRATRPDLHLPTEAEYEAIVARRASAGEAWVWEYLPDPRRLPLGWRLLEVVEMGLAAERKDGLRVIADGGVELDGNRWLHASCSRAGKTPGYYDLKATYQTFIGHGLHAYQLFVAPGEHVSINEVLHLWSCVDRPAYLPNFTAGFDTI
jgi:hypothetical protein